jgi:crossover junction endodeoxyribonuclease RusA
MSVITLPWPAKQVWPNFRQSHHWRTYAQPVKDQREMAFWTAKSAKLRPVWVGEHIPLTVTISPPDRRRRDRDGMTGACKSILDGIADAMGVDDQNFAPTYVFTDPVKGGLITVETGS